MSSMTNTPLLRAIILTIVIMIVVFSEYVLAVPNKAPGYFAKKLDEYYSTIKCMLNIMEDLAPEYNSLMVCCGVWVAHDWMGSMVLDNCYDHNYHQINNLTEPFIRHMEENCYDYPRDSISCKMMLVTPIFILVLILLFMILLSICAIITCVRLKRLQRYHEYQTSQGFDSSGTEETTDGADPVLEKKKQLQDV